MILTSIDKIAYEQYWVKDLSDVVDYSKVVVLDTFVVPSALADKIYAILDVIGMSENADVILAFNNLNPLDIPAGTEIKIPVLDSYWNAKTLSEPISAQQTTGGRLQSKVKAV